MRALLLIALSLCVGLASCACPHVTYASATKFSALNLAPGTVVTIPAGQTYLYDRDSSPQLGGIHIYGRLVFDDTKDVALDTEMITVQDGGEFLIGSCDCPFEHKAIITLYGEPTTSDPDGIGTKVIGAVGTGKLQFYGKVRGPTWTRLASSVSQGATSFTLVEPVDWQVGDIIAIASTDFPRWQDPDNPLNWEDGTENATIAAISADKKTITVTTPIKYPHYSGESHGIEMRGEVGLLTRNIVIRGDDSSLITEFGAHFMFIDKAVAVLSGVEVTRAGQKRHLGRYPIHFHRMYDAPGNAVLDSSIHNNFQRAITIHSTNKVVVRRNVAYRTFGHMMFLEDGNERDNIIEHNLFMVVFKIKEADMLPGIRSDDKPAVIWITNPANTFRSNVAVGSPHICIWYALPVNPMGPSHTRAIVPRWTPLQEFSHNEAHTCGMDGLHIDEGPNQEGVTGAEDPPSISQYVSVKDNGEKVTLRVGAAYEPISDPTEAAITDYETFTSLKPVPAVFEAFKAWKCRNRAVWVRASYSNFTHNKYADCAIGITFATVGSGVGGLSDSIMVGQSDNYGFVSDYEERVGAYDYISGPNPPYRSVPVDWPPVADIPQGHLLGPFFPIRGYEFYDGPNEIRNVKFYNYIPNARRNASCISMLRDDQFSISQSNRGSQVTCNDGSRMLYFPDLSHDGDKENVFLDMDGSITGRPPQGENIAAVTQQVPIYWTSSCVRNDDSHTFFCPNHFASFFVNYETPVTYPPSLPTLPGLVEIYRSDRLDAPLHLCGGPCNGGTHVVEVLQPASTFFGSLPLWHDYYYHFKTSAPERLTARVGNHRHSVNKDRNSPYNELRVAFCYPQGSTVKSIMWNWKDNVQSAASYEDMMSRSYTYSWNSKGDGMWFWDSDAGYLWVRFIIQESQEETPVGVGAGGWITIEMNIGGGPMNCVPTADPPKEDTIRILPPVGTPPTPPAFSPEPPRTPRDDSSTCAPVNPDCMVSEWSTYGPCESPNPCSETESIPGTQTRTRTVIQQPQSGGAPCPLLSETRNCTIPKCGTDVDCVMSPWTDAGMHCRSCSGTVEQVRSIVVHPLGNGKPCGSTARVALCSDVLAGCTNGASVLRFFDMAAFLTFLAAVFALF